MCNFDVLLVSPFCPVIVSDDGICLIVSFPFYSVIVSDDHTCFTVLFH